MSFSEKKNLKEDPTALRVTNNAVENAIDALKEELQITKYAIALDSVFENRFNCKINYLDEYGIDAFIKFNSEEEKTFFVLKYGS